MSEVGDGIIESLEEILAYKHGKTSMDARIVTDVDVVAIRKRLRMSQARFADTYGLSKRLVQDWEQKKARPSGAARTYLTVIEKMPVEVARVLASEDAKNAASDGTRRRSKRPPGKARKKAAA